MTEEQNLALDALVQSKIAEKKAEREGKLAAFMDASDYIYQKHHANYATQMAGKAVGGAADLAANVSRSEAGKMVFTDFGASDDDRQALRAHDAYRKAGVDLEGRIQRHRNIVRYRSITNDSRTPLVDVTQKYRSQLKFDDYDKAVSEAERRNKASGVNTSGLKPEEWPVTPEDVMDEEYLSVVAAKEDTAVGKRYQKLRKFGEGIRDELRPDWAKKAESWSDAVPHSKVGQMFLDASQNVANLAAAGTGKAINAVTGAPSGSIFAAGTLAMSEQGGFLKQADPLIDKGLPIDLAEKYSLEYGALSGAIEYSSQALNVATLGGSGWVGKAIGSKVVPRGVVGKFAKWAAGRGLDAAGEGLEEAWQEALQYYTVEKMLGEWGERTGKKDFSKELEGMSLPLTKEGKVDWKAARSGLLRAFESGMNVSLALGSIRAPVDAYQGVKAQVRDTAKSSLEQLRELSARYSDVLRVVPDGEAPAQSGTNAERAKGPASFSDEQIDAWVDAHPDEATAVAGKDALTRKDWEAMGLDRARQDERARFLARVKARQAEVKPAETVQEEKQEAVQVDETSDETAPDQDEAETPTGSEAEDTEASKAPEALPERLAAFAEPDLDAVLDEASAAVEESRKAARRKGKSQIEARLAFAGPASGKAPRIGQDGVSDEAALERAQIRRRHSPEVAADVDALHGILGSAWDPKGEGFDEAAYERAAPHLRNVLEDFSKTGKSPADFAAAIVGEFGHAREYVKRMARDLASGRADVQTTPRAAASGEVATAPQATQASGERPANESAVPTLGSLMSKAEKANFAKMLDAAAKGRKRMEHLDEQAKKTKFKRTTAKVALKDGKTEDQVGLAYKHVMFHKGSSGWIVTHMASGLGVPIKGGMNDARIAAMRLAYIIPEDVSQGLPSDVQVKVRKISRDPYADTDESAASSATVETPPREGTKTREVQGEAALRGIEAAVESGFSDMPALRSKLKALRTKGSTQTKVGDAISEALTEERSRQPASKSKADVAQREHAERVKAVRALTPVDVSTETRVENKAEAKRVFAAFGDVKNASDGRVVRFPSAAAGKILRHKGFDTGRIVGILNKVFENSLHAWSEAETAKEGHKTHRNIEQYHNYVGKIVLDGRNWFVRFTVQQMAVKGDAKAENLVHSSFVSEVSLYAEKEAEDLSLPVIDRMKVASASPFVDKKLAQWLSSVNPSAAGPRVLEDGPDTPAFDKRKTESTGTAPAEAPLARDDLVDFARDLFPGLAIRGRATWRRKNALGWFDPKNNLIRSNDPNAIDVIAHELGHYVDHATKTTKIPLPKEVKSELDKMGRELYQGHKAPANGYVSEGWAEFIYGWLTATEDMPVKSPSTLTWFNVEWMPANPEMSVKLAKLQGKVQSFKAQRPEDAVRGFWKHVNPGSFISSIPWRRLKTTYHNWVDDNHFLLSGMRKAGIDVDIFDKSLTPEQQAERIINSPYLKATLYKNAESKKIVEMALNGTTNLLGTERTGESLSDALRSVARDPVRYDQWKDYAVARMAREYRERGMPSGLSDAEVDKTVAKYQSKEFDDALDSMTEWSRRLLHLLVESGNMTQEEFDKIAEANPIYVKFMRRFREDLVNRRAMGSGKAVYRRKGGTQSIEDPIAALLVDAQKIIASAQQADVSRCIVDAVKQAKPGSDVAENWLVEVAAPKEAVKIPLDRIKRDIARIAVEDMGADPDKAKEAIDDDWTDSLTIFQNAAEYRGKDRIVGIVIDGKRRFFEVKDERLFNLLANFRKETADGPWMKAGTKVMNGIRLGATILNPAFAILRNPVRDTLTAAVFADYHTHIPVASLVTGIVKDWTDVDTSTIYNAMGLPMDAFNARNLRPARHLEKQVAAATGFQRTMRSGIVNMTANALSTPEIGARILEFKGAYEYWMKRTGSHDAAAIVAGCAAGDVTVNFRRSGALGSQISKQVLFFNAGVQSIDKFLRMLGAIEALPWEIQQKRSDRLMRTVLRAGGYITATSLALYAFNRERNEEWWDELPPGEKWGYFHFGSKVRLPVPFELGLFFGALPIAILEERRKPGSVLEVLSLMADSAPIQLGGFHDIARNLTVIAPIADIIANKNWNGSTLVPEQFKRGKRPVDWHTPNTSTLAKGLGRLIWKAVEGTDYEDMAAPIYIEHLLNQYSGGMYKGVANIIDNMRDPSNIMAGGDPSTLPLLGTAFTRPNTSRLTGDFYDRKTRLDQAYGSREIGLEELGERKAMTRTADKLSDIFSDSRAVRQNRNKRRGAVKVETDALTAQALEVVRAHNEAADPAAFRRQGIRAAVVMLTDEKATESDREFARGLLEDVPPAERLEQLRQSVLSSGGRAAMRYSNGSLTPYAKRVYRLQAAMKKE